MSALNNIGCDYFIQLNFSTFHRKSHFAPSSIRQEGNFSSRDALCTPENVENAPFHQKSLFEPLKMPKMRLSLLRFGNTRNARFHQKSHFAPLKIPEIRRLKLKRRRWALHACHFTTLCMLRGVTIAVCEREGDGRGDGREGGRRKKLKKCKIYSESE